MKATRCALSVVVMFVTACSGSGLATIEIVNQSSHIVQRLEVKIGEQTQLVNGIQPGERREISMAVRHDSSYDIDVQFEDGRESRDSFGYLTNSVEVHDRLTLTDDGIQMVRTRTQVK